MSDPPEPHSHRRARAGHRWQRWAKLGALPIAAVALHVWAGTAASQADAPVAAPAAASPAGADSAKADDKGADKAADERAKEEAKEGAAEATKEGDKEGAKDGEKEEKKKPSAPIVGEKVVVGAYLNDIQSLDLKTHSYAADVYLWFRWKNKDINPAEGLEFVNPADLWGHVRNNDHEEPEELDTGEQYQVVRVQGRFSCKLPLYDYPLDRQTLFIEFEDKNHDAKAMSYVPDGTPIAINPDVRLPGMAIGAPTLKLTVRKYASNFGDPRSDKHLEFSRARIEVPVSRPPLPHLIKMLLPVVCVTLCAMMMFLFRATYVDSRVELGITSLLTVVALQMTLNQDLPDIAYLVLIDEVYIATYLYVMAGIGVVVKTTHMNDDGNEVGAKRVNRIGMLVTTTLYFVALAALIVPKLT